MTGPTWGWGWASGQPSRPFTAWPAFTALPFPLVVQPFLDGARDLRVVVVGDYAEAYERRNPQGFRKNLFQGGTFHAVDMSPELQDFCRRVMARGRFPYAVLDVLISPGGEAYLAEINFHAGLKGSPNRPGGVPPPGGGPSGGFSAPMGKIKDDPALRNKTYVFADRAQAGQKLAAMLRDYAGKPVRLFAIPAGGVPVAVAIARTLAVPLDLIIVRKIQLPWTTEAGFGALDPDGTPLFNDALLSRMPLTPQQIEAQVAKTLANLKEREELLRGGRPYPDLKGATTIVVDDGLASGYTMRAALRFLKARGRGGAHRGGAHGPGPHRPGAPSPGGPAGLPQPAGGLLLRGGRGL